MMNPEDIRATIRKKYGSMAALSRKFNVHMQSVAQTVSRPGFSRRLEQEIAKSIDIPVQKLWPARYQPDGTPIPHRDQRQVG